VEHNRELSYRRAAAVQKWLVSFGLDAGRFESKGFGPARPIDTNNTDVGRQNNRRVEFHIAQLAPGTKPAAAAPPSSSPAATPPAPATGSKPAPTPIKP
jgi:hypothetical protein